MSRQIMMKYAYHSNPLQKGLQKQSNFVAWLRPNYNLAEEQSMKD